MNKLGFAINYSSEGYGTDIICNSDGGNWTNSVDDIRNYLKFFNGLRGTNKIITFISFDENGAFLTLLRNVSGRGIDFRAGWIYIPNEIEISISEIMDVYEHAKLWLQKSISDTKSDIEEYFLKKYAPKKYFFKNVASSGEDFGYRKLGHFTIEETLGSDIYQEYYDGCKAIFLIEDNSITISDEYATRFNDFTQRNIEKYCILMPPTKETLLPFGLDTMIYDERGRVFDSPIRVKQGGQVKLFAQRKGLDSLRLNPITVNHSVEKFPSYQKVEWKKTVELSMFYVTNLEGKELKNASIIVCGQHIFNKNVVLTEDEARRASVSIKVNGYEEKSGTFDLLCQRIPINIDLKEEKRPVQILLSNDRIAEITLTNKDRTAKDLLLGYYYDKVQEMYIPNSLYKWKQRLIGFAMCVALLFLAGVMYSFSLWLDNHEFRLGIPPWQEIKNSAVNVEAQDDVQNEETDDKKTIAPPYLDNTTTWNKDSLEIYEETMGLFNALNTFDFSKIKEYEGKLGNSKNFMKIVDKIKETENMGFDPNIGKEAHGGKYNSESDKLIDIDNYIKWISSYHEPTYTPPVSEAKTSGKIKGGNAKKSNGSKAKPKSTTGNKTFQTKRGGED